MTVSRSLSLLILLFLSQFLLSQDAMVRGTVRDDNGTVIPQALIYVEVLGLAISSDSLGRYEIQVPGNREIEVKATYPSYLPFSRTLTLNPGEAKKLNITLKISELLRVDVIDEAVRYAPIERLSPKLQRRIPSPTGGIEALLIGQLGVSANNELSSTYSVRGGSFDENLVYVNDIEVYRPFLTRSGNQEGLSFANPDMTSDILFSSGGFDAKYGDKMSSVLDVKYSRPERTEGSFQGGLLGGAVHYGGVNRNGRLGHITGFRYRTNQSLLGTLDDQGDYRSRFFDLQTYLTYGLSDTWQLEFLGNISSNLYNFIPRTRTTQLGSINEALQLTVFFEGQEITDYETYFGAFSFTNTPVPQTKLKYIVSAFRTYEREKFDVFGQYRLDELERDLGSDEFGEVVRNLGIGAYLDHARNSLDATVLNVEHKGISAHGNHTILWGLGARNERINDRLSEWGLIDSAGYSVPHNPNGPIVLDDFIRSSNELNSQRFTAYAQDNVAWTARDSSIWDLSAGMRGQHWTYNGQTMVSPRARIAYKPQWKSVLIDSNLVKRDVIFKAAVGIYYQAPFYRELRDLSGAVNQDIRAQRSIHFVTGADMLIKLFGRPFRMITEAYYKIYDDLIPYELENVRLRYYATNNAKGFAYGLDTKLTGEFLPGVQSWASLSFLNVKEDITDDFYLSTDVDGNETRVEPGYIPRPTDQRVTFSMFFQDEMPRNPSYKVQLSVNYGTGLPFGPPGFDRYRDTLRTPSYRRFDIGFIKQFVDENTEFRNPDGFFSNFKEVWIALEVFNLLDVPNVQSYLWVRDVRGRQYGVPNYLTPRTLNLKVYFRF